jgi:hypothetical protein
MYVDCGSLVESGVPRMAGVDRSLIVGFGGCALGVIKKWDGSLDRWTNFERSRLKWLADV